MGNVTSSASIRWEGNVARGSGAVTGGSGVLADVPVDLPTRIGEGAGDKVSPEELLAAAHVACLTMSIGSALAAAKTPAERLDATSRVPLVMSGERPQIGDVVVQVRGTVPGLDQTGFQAVVEQAVQGCLISRVIKAGGTISIDVTATLA